VLVAIYISIGKKKILKKLLTKKYYGGISPRKFKAAAFAAVEGVQHENGIADGGESHCD